MWKRDASASQSLRDDRQTLSAGACFEGSTTPSKRADGTAALLRK
jgi:hypothetical protein